MLAFVDKEIDLRVYDEDDMDDDDDSSRSPDPARLAPHDMKITVETTRRRFSFDCEPGERILYAALRMA